MPLMVEEGQIVSGFLPVNLSTAANTGDYISMKAYHHLAVVFFKGAAGSSGQDPTLTIVQATTVGGAGAKALNFTTIYTKEATVLTATGSFTKVTQSAGNTYTSLTSSEKAALWIVEFDGEDLDRDNDFDCVMASVADTGSWEQPGCVLYLLTDTRYGQAAPPSAIID